MKNETPIRKLITKKKQQLHTQQALPCRFIFSRKKKRKEAIAAPNFREKIYNNGTILSPYYSCYQPHSTIHPSEGKLCRTNTFHHQSQNVCTNLAIQIRRMLTSSYIKSYNQTKQIAI